MKLPAITDGERDTLLACLDFCASQVSERIRKGYSQDTEQFALNIAHVKITKLRAKLFPQLRPAISQQPKAAP